MPLFIRKCSETGPKDSAGKCVNPPTISITDKSNPMNNKESVRKVPEEGGVIFFKAILPAMASTGIITPKRPRSIPKPRVRL